METDTRIASAVALISAEPRNLGAGDDARVQEIVNVQTNNLQNAGKNSYIPV